MSNDLKELARELGALPVSSRTFLLDKLWESLDVSHDPGVEKAWLEEAERRWEELESGRVKPIPEAQVMKDARKALKKCG
jgi:putative addiction module component (TIGR02574 family)